MNGEESVIRPQASSVSDGTQPITDRSELNNIEKMDLIVLSSNPAVHALWKFMELEIIHARNDAMFADPSIPTAQLAKLTIAHAMEKFYRGIREQIKFITDEHLGEARRLEYERKMAAPEQIEQVILDQAR